MNTRPRRRFITALSAAKIAESAKKAERERKKKKRMPDFCPLCAATLVDRIQTQGDGSYGVLYDCGSNNLSGHWIPTKLCSQRRAAKPIVDAVASHNAGKAGISHQREEETCKRLYADD